jgi:hypothetical protein
MSRREVLAFFRRYRTAFDCLDGDAVAALWHTPSAIAPMRDNMRALCDLYRRNGHHTAEFELLDHLRLGRDQSFARLRWTLRRRDASVLQRFGTGYHLLRGEDGIRVLAVAAFAENIRTLKRNTHAAQ